MDLWKEISKESKQLELDCIFALRDGSIISFWKDTWCGESPLFERFPALYNLAAAKRAKVANI